MRNKKWSDLIKPDSNYRFRAFNNRKLLRDARRYVYPIFDELKIEVNSACRIPDEIANSMKERIRHQMQSTRKEKIAVVYEVLDRLPPSKRKDKTTTLVKREGSVIVQTSDDIDRAVHSMITEINKLAPSSPFDGYKVRVRLGSVITLEGFCNPGDDDVHKLSR